MASFNQFFFKQKGFAADLHIAFHCGLTTRACVWPDVVDCGKRGLTTKLGFDVPTAYQSVAHAVHIASDNSAKQINQTILFYRPMQGNSPWRFQYPESSKIPLYLRTRCLAKQNYVRLVSLRKKCKTGLCAFSMMMKRRARSWPALENQ